MRSTQRLSCALRGVFLVGLIGFSACTSSTDGSDADVPLPRRLEEADASFGEDGSTISPGGDDAGTDAATDAPNEGGTIATYCNVDDLIACFTFEGAVTDHAPAAHVPSLLQNVTYAPGKHGSALVLGATTNVRFAPSATWNSASITVEAWVRPAVNNTEMVIFDADQRYVVIKRDNGEIRCGSPGGNVDGGSVPAGVWTHVACVYSGGSVGVYTAGVLRDVEDGGTGASLGAGTALGADAPNGAAFIGAIDSLRVFRVARSGAQIAAAAAL
jgi:hypothetical protein